MKNFQLYLYNLLERPELSKYGFLVSQIIFINIFINMFVIIAMSFLPLKETTYHLFQIINTINVILFIIELVFRYIAIGIDEKYRGIVGRIKYTFSFYTMVDIISIIPFFVSSYALSYLRFFRFLRILKVFRFKNYLYKMINFEIFATSNIFIQFMMLFVTSFLIIFIFRFAYESSSLSIALFLDPSALSDTSNLEELTVGIVEVVIGLIIGGTLISIITESIAQKVDEVKKGFNKYKLKNHIIIFNKNEQIEFILDELDKYYNSISYMQEIGIFLPNFDNIEYFYNNLKKYNNLDIKVITGDAFNWESFDRISINQAKKIILLEDDKMNKSQIIKVIRFITTNDNFCNTSLEFIIETSEYFNGLKNIYNVAVHNYKHSIIYNKEVVEMFLNRSIIDINYFKILTNLLSFEGVEFSIIPKKEVIEEKITFKNLSFMLNDVVLIGIIKNNTYMLNPKKDIVIENNDKLICMCNEKIDIYNIDNSKKDISCNTNLILSKPEAKENKKLCVIGDFNDININDVTQFLTDDSVENITYIIKDNYMDEKLWIDIRNKQFDLILLSLEDNYEFLLTLYLKDIFSDDKEFLSKIVNILHDSNTAILLEEKGSKSNIILSNKLMGQYIAQLTIYKEVEHIFDEITHSYGNEFYILTREKYNKLFNMSYEILKQTLLENDIIYIGIIDINGEFIFNAKDIAKANKIIVLTEGV